MSKGIIILAENPKACIECPMHFHATDISIGSFQYERLFRCELEPEDVEQVYLEDICHKKPDWCPIRPIPEKKEVCGRYPQPDGVPASFKVGWNACIEEILGNETR